MKSNEFQLLATNCTIDHVVIWRDPTNAGAWTVYGYGEDNRPLGTKEVIEAARGGARMWASLDTAVAWLRGAGWAGDVTIQG